MKLNCIYSFLAAAGVMMFATACSDDDYKLDDATVTPEQLVPDEAFAVVPDADNPNVIHLISKMKGVTPLWETPQGRSQESEYTIDLPFAGDYEVTFGVMTKAGPVYGNPYTFNVPQNDFSMLSDPIWTNLAGGVDEAGNGNPKKWVPMDRSYGVGYGSSPMMYLDPDHVNNDGVENKDLLIGSENWAPNWDPGFQSWLIPADDPYMESYMVFGLDAVKGCTLTEMRKTASGEEVVEGTFTLNISDPKRPTITFNGGTYAMHNAGMDGTCSNYTQDIKILECTPYVLQFATMRTNSEGPWWLVWNFVAADVQDGTVTIPLGPELIEEAAPEYPEYKDYYENDILQDLLFRVAGNEVVYDASKVVYHLDEEAPYDVLQWNGTGTNGWVAQELYGTIDYPAYSGDFSLTFERDGLKASVVNDTYASYQGGEFLTTFSAAGGKIHFNDEVTLLQSGNAKVAGQDFVVFRCNTDDGLQIGAPCGTDQNGVVNRYLVLNLVPEPVGGAVSGPTVLPFKNENIAGVMNVEGGNYLRIPLYNPWAGKDDSVWPVDPNLLKLKKNQVLTVKMTISGIDWTGTPKAVICAQNFNSYGWDSAAYAASPYVVDLNTSGETTLTIMNETGSTYSFYGNDAIEISIDLAANASSADISNCVVEFTSVTIE